MAGISPVKLAMITATSGACPRPLGAGEHEAIPSSARFDPHVAHPARVYNLWLGGKDGYAADREAAEQVARCRPQVAVGARANRALLARVVRYLAAQRGIRQFLDIGTGLPAPGSTHEVAQAVAPESRVVYVDNDPQVLSHARALLGSGPRGACAYIEADVRDPGAVLDQAAQTLDLARPTAVLLLAILHFVPDIYDPEGIVARLVAGLAPGSLVAVSHLTADFAPEQLGSAVAAYNALVPVGVTARSHAGVTALFGRMSLVAPGVVPVAEWRPDAGWSAQPADLYAGVASTGRWSR
jgi:hypothetical protein